MGFNRKDPGSGKSKLRTTHLKQSHGADLFLKAVEAGRVMSFSETEPVSGVVGVVRIKGLKGLAIRLRLC